jgi:isopenicillin-N epimerase
MATTNGEEMNSDLSRHWLLDPAVTFLNHGSFGACPIPVLEAQQRWREQMEREPVRFMAGELEGRMDEARADLARFVGARSDDLAFVRNATTGVNAVLRSLELSPDDELLVTDHEYNACRNALRFVAERSGARIRVIHLPFPLRSPEDAVDAVLDAVTPRTRLALLDHITSPTGLILPIETLVHELERRGVDTLVDGAHGPGMVPLNLAQLGAAYYTGNCHKWLCAPKGAAFLHVRPDRQAGVHPLTISHGANSTRTDRSRFRLEFDWTGTFDPSPFLVIPEAIRFLGGLLPGGWPALMDANRSLALAGRSILCEALAIDPPAPAKMIGALGAVPLPDGSGEAPPSPLYQDPLQDRLLAEHAIQVPVLPWPDPPRRLIRISAQAYNRREQYERLARVLTEVLED